MEKFLSLAFLEQSKEVALAAREEIAQRNAQEIADYEEFGADIATACGWWTASQKLCKKESGQARACWGQILTETRATRAADCVWDRLWSSPPLLPSYLLNSP